mmetsp:Transcript_48470/g.160616  ORF Transcript_48470/g.160616 Transcript_48470/m.160616 type:complete len:348 (-) Transcript_48470:470-1513(-)
MALALATLALGAGRSLSVVSWNILAPTFAPPSRYPWVAPATLAWPKREAAIVATLGRLDADVVCLQEVEVALWDGLLRRLTSLGYSGVLQETQRQHPIANAVLFRRAALRCTQTESRSRALIAVLESLDAADSAAPLHVASVHLEAGAEKASQRFCQLRSLLRRLTLLQQRDEKERSGPPAVLIAGDFNFDRRSALHQLLCTGSLPPHERGSSAYGESVPLVRAGSAPYQSPLLPLRDAYRDGSPPWGPQLRASFRNGRVLDFVWHSAALHCLRPMPVCAEAGSPQPKAMPSETHPSDHLPVGALFSWPGAPGCRAEAPSWQQLYVENVIQSRPASRPVSRASPGRR